MRDDRVAASFKFLFQVIGHFRNQRFVGETHPKLFDQLTTILHAELFERIQRGDINYDMAPKE